MKWFAIALFAILLYLQYRLWLDEGGMRDLSLLQKEIAEQKAENERLLKKNRALAAEVEALKNKDDAIEERARTDLGMIKEGETFIMIVPEEQKKQK